MATTETTQNSAEIRRQQLLDEMAMMDKMVRHLDERLDESHCIWSKRGTAEGEDTSPDQLSSTRSSMAIMKQSLQIFKAKREAWKEIEKLETRRGVPNEAIPNRTKDEHLSEPFTNPEALEEPPKGDPKFTDPNWMAHATDQELIEAIESLETGKKPPFIFKRATAGYQLRKRKLSMDLTHKVANALDGVPPFKLNPQFLVSSM